MSIDMGSACFSGGGSKRTPEQNEATYLQKTTRGEVKISCNFLGRFFWEELGSLVGGEAPKKIGMTNES